MFYFIVFFFLYISKTQQIYIKNERESYNEHMHTEKSY